MNPLKIFSIHVIQKILWTWSIWWIGISLHFQTSFSSPCGAYFLTLRGNNLLSPNLKLLWKYEETHHANKPTRSNCFVLFSQQAIFSSNMDMINKISNIESTTQKIRLCRKKTHPKWRATYLGKYFFILSNPIIPIMVLKKKCFLMLI